jgi:hypothetical protein
MFFETLQSIPLCVNSKFKIEFCLEICFDFYLNKSSVAHIVNDFLMNKLDLIFYAHDSLTNFRLKLDRIIHILHLVIFYLLQRRLIEWSHVPLTHSPNNRFSSNPKMLLHRSQKSNNLSITTQKAFEFNNLFNE